jgi:hypothetical protein
MDIESRDQWKLDKWGKFSASEIHKLLTPGPVLDKMTGERAMFGEEATTYINRIARECYTAYNEDENPMSYAMKIGIEREAEGAGHYMRYIGIDKFVYYGVGNSKFFPYGDHAGVSPDTVLWVDEEKQIASLGAEGKNPTPKIHDYYLDKIKDAKDLERECPDYYAQVQFSMLVFNCDLWHWYSHNIYFRGSERMLLIQVPENKNFQHNLSQRLKRAIKLKLERIENHKQRLTRLV